MAAQRLERLREELLGQYPGLQVVVLAADLSDEHEAERLLAPTSAVSDVASLQLAEAEAKVALQQAQRDRARAERLLAAGAVPARRVEDARSLEATVQARLQAAQARLAQYEATRTADGAEAGLKRFLVRAPISGIISEVTAISGASVEPGPPLFRIVDTDTVFVSGAVPESELGKLRQISARK